MDRPPVPVGGTQIPLGVATDAVRQELVRLLDLKSGQRAQATVAAILGNGRVLLGLMGGLVEAWTTVELEVGRSYEFTVAATQPRIVLSAARPIVFPGVGGAVSMGLLGPAQPPPLEVLTEAVTITDKPGAGPTDREAPVREQLTQALTNLRRGAPSAADLQTIHRLLGHDQEARVLRLPTRPQPAEVQVLRHTLKADMLQVLERGDEATRPPRTDAVARELIAGLSRIEVDNAQRSEQGAPQWFPLPVHERGELRDARMFALWGEHAGDGAEPRTEAGGLTVVLLLDFTKLGQIRVDLQMQGAALAATFVAVESSTVHSLVASMPELRERLESEELEVGALTVRAAPSERLPIADLLNRPPTATSMVDIRA